ncbi:MAG: tetratricopeptide repeat protein [Planctomycetia bacterium]|nr:tetratricopeptide repeat protein [Planctomycetia bacterium]
MTHQNDMHFCWSWTTLVARSRARPSRIAIAVAVACAVPLAGALVLPPSVAEAQRAARSREPKADGGAYAAFQLLRRGQELLDSGEHDRGAKIMETIIEQYPGDPIRFKAYLALGKHSLSRSEQLEAIGYLRNLKGLEQPGVEMDAEARELFLEGLYLQGIALKWMPKPANCFWKGSISRGSPIFKRDSMPRRFRCYDELQTISQTPSGQTSRTTT